jgi:hypothetical protein
LDRYGYGYDNPATLSDPTGLYVELENRGSVALAWQSKLAPIGAAPKPVTGRYHARWPSRRAVPRAPEPRPAESGITPFGRDTGSVRLDGNRYPIPRQRLSADEQSIWDAGQELLEGPSSPVGGCGSVQALVGVGGGGSACRIDINGERGMILTPFVGVGLEGASVGGGPLYSNAKRIGDLAGRTTCLSGGGIGVGGGGSMTICGSTTSGHNYTGTVTVYLAGEIGSPGPIGSISRGETLVVRADPVAGLQSWWESVWAPFRGGSL